MRLCLPFLSLHLPLEPPVFSARDSPALLQPSWLLVPRPANVSARRAASAPLYALRACACSPLAIAFLLVCARLQPRKGRSTGNASVGSQRAHHLRICRSRYVYRCAFFALDPAHQAVAVHHRTPRIAKNHGIGRPYGPSKLYQKGLNLTSRKFSFNFWMCSRTPRLTNLFCLANRMSS